MSTELEHCAGAYQSVARFSGLIFRWGISAASLACSQLAYAQQEPQGQDGFGDIVVTARKQTERLLDVPVAVTAISGEALKRQGVSDLRSIAHLAPQVMISQGDSGAGATFSIRGLGSSYNDSGIDQSVVVNLDGIGVTRGNIVKFGMFDLAQVEVLKGPQALFFGKNSPAGVISLTSKGGTDKLEGFVQLGYEIEAHERFIEAGVSGPLTGTLKGRVAVRASDMRGWLKNVAQPMTAAENPLKPNGSPGGAHHYGPGDNDILGRVTLNWDPSPEFSATLKVGGGKHKDNGSTTQAFCFNGTAPQALGLEDPYNDCRFDGKYTLVGLDPALIDTDWKYMNEDGEPYAKLRAIYSSLNLEYGVDDLSFTSVTGYMRFKSSDMVDYAYTSHGALNGATGEKYRSISQEFRLTSSYDASVNFTLGAYYEDVTRRYDVNSLLFYVGPDPLTGNNRTFGIANDADGETVSAFGQVRWKVSDAIELAGGARYTKEKRTQFTRNTYTHPVAGPIVGLVDYRDPNNGMHGEFEDTNWSPEVTASYKIAPDMMIYAAYKTGYKSGGFSSPALYQYDPATATLPGGPFPFSAEKLSFGPEKSSGFEIGLKGLVFDRRLRFELTGYRYNYKNLQLTAFDPEAFAFFIANAGAARISGLEMLTEFKVTPRLTLFANAAYNRARFTKFATGQCYTGQPSSPTPRKGYCTNNTTDLSGTPLTRAPDWTLSGGFIFDTAIGGHLRLGIHGDVDWKDDYITQEDHNPMALQKAFARINAGFRIYTEDERYEFAVIGRNLADKSFFELSSGKSFGNPAGFGDLQAPSPRRRQVTISGIVRF